MLHGKTVVLGVTGSVAAYKTANLASMLVKQHAAVHVIMTKNATHFINPIAFESLTATKCLVDTFDRNFQFHVGHVSIAKQADIVMIAPASANVIGKIASGIADDMLTTTVMACKAPILVSPAMNTNMYENPVLQENLRKLRDYGMEVIEPATGMLACRDVGAGKMPEPEVLLQYILKTIACKKDLSGKRVLVTAGVTQEAIDPVRYITNHSTGKMGYAVAKAAMLRGADVTLISTPTAIETPPFVKTVPVVSAEDMYRAAEAEIEKHDILIMAAAVADFRPKQYTDHKIKKEDRNTHLELERTVDILSALAEKKKENQYFCGFSMETEHMVENSKAKLVRKNLDLIAANSLRTEGAGFAVDTNVLTLITKEEIKELPLLSKEEAAHELLDYILEQEQS